MTRAFCCRLAAEVINHLSVLLQNILQQFFWASNPTSGTGFKRWITDCLASPFDY